MCELWREGKSYLAPREELIERRREIYAVGLVVRQQRVALTCSSLASEMYKAPCWLIGDCVRSDEKWRLLCRHSE